VPVGRVLKRLPYHRFRRVRIHQQHVEVLQRAMACARQPISAGPQHFGSELGVDAPPSAGSSEIAAVTATSWRDGCRKARTERPRSSGP
jgi:hypothetical protein